MVIILGLGFTGACLARRLLRNGVQVFAAVRDTGRFHHLAAAGLQLSELTLNQPEAMNLPPSSTMAVLIPPLAEPEKSALRYTINHLAPKRLVYVSSTGVYGDRSEVGWDTPAEPNDDRGRMRIDEERWVASGPWTSLILRAAAIYGPGRGVHASLREGRLPRGIGSGLVSRIHVEDLAAIIEAGLFSDVRGAWPVADEVPCSSAQIIQWCANLLRLEIPVAEVGDKMIGGRKVDGGRIRQILRVGLKYPSWETGIAACLAEEDSRKEELKEEKTARS